jgi:hypothetical protein
MGYIGNSVVGVEHPSKSALNATTGDFTGAVTADAGVVVDNITIDGTEIDLSSGDLTIDVAGDISLDAGGADINLKDDGTRFGILYNSSSDFHIEASVQDKDIKFLGNDGGSGVTALKLDMSEGGDAQFSRNVGIGGTPNNYSGYSALTLNHATNGGLIDLELNGTLKGEIFLTSSALNIKSIASDENIVFSGNDGGSGITALTLDMSDAGKAIFNSGATFGSSVQLTDGDLVVASGHGISFAATSDAGGMTSELLDDYEEGTFTPRFQQGITTPGYATQIGTYIKIGRQVICSIYLRANSGTANNGHIYIGGLPFTVTNDIDHAFGAFFTYNGGFWNPDANVQWLAFQNTTNMGFYKQSNGGAIVGNATGVATDLNADCRLVAIYRTD